MAQISTRLKIAFTLISTKGVIDNVTLDPRPAIFTKVAEKLQKKHDVYIYWRYGLSYIMNKWMEKIGMKRYDKEYVDIVVKWVHERHPMYLRKDGITLYYENGPIHNSVVVDPSGLLSSSFYANAIDKVVTSHSCNSSSIKSKRYQSSIHDIPDCILNKYLLVPTQKATDYSLRKKFSPVSMFDLIKEAYETSVSLGLSIVYKIHPHLVGADVRQQVKFIRLLPKQENVYISKMSIDELTKRAVATITLNGGTVYDNFRTQSPVITVAKNMFSKSDAVVYTRNITKAVLSIMGNGWNDERKMLQNRIICWMNNVSLNADKSADDNIKALQYHIHKVSSYQIVN